MPQQNSGSRPPSDSDPATEVELPLGEPEAQLPLAPDAIDVAVALAAKGNMTQAYASLRGIVMREPANARARSAFAALLVKRGDVPGALDELTRALEGAPDDVELLCARSGLLASRGKYDQAELDLRRAAKSGTANAEVQVQLGMLFSKRARWREAIEPLLSAVAADANRADAHYQLGEAYNHIDDLPQALKSYEAAATLQPTNMRALKGIGIVLDRMGRPTEAAAAYRRARDSQKR